MQLKLLLLFLLISVEGQIINQQVTRAIDLTSQLTRIKTKIIYMHNSSEPVSFYEYIVDLHANDYHIEFRDENGDLLLYTSKSVKAPFKSLLVPHDCDKTSGSNTTYVLNVEEVHVESIKPKYKKKLFNESESVIYNSNVYYYSAYETKHYDVTFETRTKFALHYKDEKTLLNDNITMNLFNFSAHAVEMVTIKFDAEWTFLRVTNIDKTIDISHYGQIQVKDVIEIVNTGSIVHGPFVHLPRGFFHTHLPSSANNIILYDELGYIYDFEIIERFDYRTLKFKLRYPLLGGWKYTYMLTYALPTYAYLSQIDTERFSLRIRVLDHVLNDIIIESFRTKIILPEDAYYYKVDSPFLQLDDEVSHTALTCNGRRTLVFTGYHLLENHINDVIIKYVYSPLGLLRMPGKLTFFCFVPFLIIIFGQRFKEFFLLKRK